MATFERTGPLLLEPQLDGSASAAYDCGVAACVMALDDASYGVVRPSTEAVRKRMDNDRDATNPDQWKAAIDSFADRFTALGLQPPRTSVVRDRSHDELWQLLHDQRRRVIAALHYGTVADEKGKRLYPAEDRWIGLVVAKARPMGESDEGVDPGDPDGGSPDRPDVTELLEIIADTAGELEDHIASLATSLDRLRPWLPATSASASEPADGVTP